MKFVTKGGTEYKITLYEESYNEVDVQRTVTFDSSVDLPLTIAALTEDELSDAQIVHATTTVDLPPLVVESGYRAISVDSIPMSSVCFREVEQK